MDSYQRIANVLMGRPSDELKPDATKNELWSPSTVDVKNFLSQIPVHSGGLLPLTEYGDGSVRFDSSAGLLGGLTAPARAYRGEIAPDQMVPEALKTASLAMTGGLLAPAQRGALGANRFTLPHYGNEVTILENPTASELSAFIGRTKYKAARALKDTQTGDHYFWDGADPALHANVAKQLNMAPGKWESWMATVD